MLADKVFLDSNVLLYMLQIAPTPKVHAAREWVQAVSSLDAACTNLQVLNETTNVLLRKRPDLSAAQVFAAVDALTFLGTSVVGELTVELARGIRLATQFRWWDCLLLASAIELDCTHFLSEDLQDGRTIEGVTIVDPFAHRPEELFPPT